MFAAKSEDQGLLNGDTICIIGGNDTGKTTILHHLVAEVLSSKQIGGLDVGVIYLDTDGSFDINLLMELIHLMPLYEDREISIDGRSIHVGRCRGEEKEPSFTTMAMENLYYGMIESPLSLFCIIDELDTFLSSHPNYRFIILDSLTFWPHDTIFFASEMSKEMLDTVRGNDECMSFKNGNMGATSNKENSEGSAAQDRCNKRFVFHSTLKADNESWKSSSLLTAAFQKLLWLQDKHHLIFVYTKSQYNMSQKNSVKKIETELPLVYTKQSQLSTRGAPPPTSSTSEWRYTYHSTDNVSATFNLPSTAFYKSETGQPGRRTDGGHPSLHSSSAIVGSNNEVIVRNTQQFTMYLGKATLSVEPQVVSLQYCNALPSYFVTAFHVLGNEGSRGAASGEMQYVVNREMKSGSTKQQQGISRLGGNTMSSVFSQSASRSDGIFSWVEEGVMYHRSSDMEPLIDVKQKRNSGECNINFYALMNPRVILLLQAPQHRLQLK